VFLQINVEAAPVVAHHRKQREETVAHNHSQSWEELAIPREFERGVDHSVETLVFVAEALGVDGLDVLGHYLVLLR